MRWFLRRSTVPYFYFEVNAREISACAILILMRERNNIAFIDGQNLHMGTSSEGWSIDHKKFRVYLRDKYNVAEAYYFLGCVDDDNQNLYSSLQRAGFIVMFREHNSAMKGKKKGNVDTDIVFEMMKFLIDDPESFNKVVLVSGDGDYSKVVDYFIEKGRFEKILFPNREYASSLYKKLTASYFSVLGDMDTRKKIEFKKTK